MSGPLTGYKVLEFAGIGPGPFCAMMLADMGAEVTRIDRKEPGFLGGGGTIVDRGRRSIALDLKSPSAQDIVMSLIERTDVLIEGFRPGVMERLGFGPEAAMARNHKLVYARVTGWGQTGPLSKAAGHDINYLAITGALHAMGYADRPPTPPLHLLGDLGAGAMFLAFGITSALLERHHSGQGQVIDAAICDAVSTLATAYHGLIDTEKWNAQRHANVLDGGSHFYRCYQCADGKYISIGPIEPAFYRTLLALLVPCGLDDRSIEDQWNQQNWETFAQTLEQLFATRTRDEWCDLLEASEACFAPVLDFEEARTYPHFKARDGFLHTDGITHPAPAPRLSRTPARAGTIPVPGEHTESILIELGITQEGIAALRQDGAIS